MQSIDERFAGFLASVKPYNYCSQFGEDGIIEAIFARIGETNRWLCECGAGDGLFMSNSRKLIEAGWDALLIEGDERQWQLLDAQPGRENVERIYARVDLVENRIESYFEGRLIPRHFDLLVIDIDGQDYWIVNSIVNYRPRVLMVEYDPNAEPDFIPEPNGPGQAGLAAIIKLGCGKLYTPICRTYCNVIFVRNDLVEKLMEGPKEEPQGIKMIPVKHGEKLSCRQCQGEILPDYVYVDKDDQKFCHVCARESDELQRERIRDYEEQLKRERIIPQPKDHVGWITENAKGETVPITISQMEELRRIHSINTSMLSRGGPTQPEIPGGQIYRPSGIAPTATGNGHMFKIAAAMSTPRLGFLSNSDCILASLAQFNIPLARGEGAFWSASLSRSIERCLEHKPDYVLTIDYDTAFHATDIAKLVCFLDDNPGIDVAVPMQMKREGGELLASTDGAVDLGQHGIPIQQGHFGLTLFRANVFERIGLPWFYERPGPDGRWNEGRVDADMGFWKNCRDHGISAYLVLGVVVGHLELVVTWPDQQLKTHYQSMNGWRDGSMKAPAIAFTRDRIQETIEHSRKLEMKD